MKPHGNLRKEFNPAALAADEEYARRKRSVR